MLRKLDEQLPSSLPEIVEHRVSLYSLGAVAAGVSLLALAAPAEGSIVVTNTNIPVTTNAFVDMNNDGINDFQFTILAGGYDHSFYRTLAVIPLTGGKPVGGARAPLGPYGSALVSGASIGPSAHFSSSVARGQVTLERTNGSVSGPTSHYTPYGQWGVNGTSHYLGVKFLISGAIHYGWIKLDVSRSSGFQALITEYAYETTANKAIGAGNTVAAESASSTLQPPSPHIGEKESKPSGPSLGMLAAGIDGIALWRR
jgi:hypothetical protein